MAKFKFGTSKDDLREELEKKEAERLLLLEQEVQERNIEKTKKLQQFNKKTKQSRLIIIISAIALSLVLLFFGVYNTFFKKSLSEEDVLRLAYSTQSSSFNGGGVEGYIYDNIDSWLNQYVKLNSNIEYYKPLKDTLRVTYLRTISTTQSTCRFSIDIETKEVDTKKTNAEGKSETVVGETKVNTYRFRTLLNFGDLNNEGYPTYSLASGLILLQQPETNVNRTNVSSYLSFADKPLMDATTSESAKVQVNNILDNIFAGKDVAGSFEGDSISPSLGYKYLGIDSNTWAFYAEANTFGYNCYFEYSVETPEGIIYKTPCYAVIEQNGNTWKITDLF